MKRPFLQIPIADWMLSPTIRSCHPISQKVLIDVMCIAAECTPYGHLAITQADIPPPPQPDWSRPDAYTRRGATAPTGPAVPAAAPPRGAPGGAPGGAPNGAPGGAPATPPPAPTSGAPGGKTETANGRRNPGQVFASIEHHISDRLQLTEEATRWCLWDLERNGALARNPAGILYSPIMVDEFNKHLERVNRARKARQELITKQNRTAAAAGAPAQHKPAPHTNATPPPPPGGAPGGAPGGVPGGAPRGGRHGAPGGVPRGPAKSESESDSFLPPMAPPSREGRPPSPPPRGGRRDPVDAYLDKRKPRRR